MPSPDRILHDLAAVAVVYLPFAVFWHLAVAAFIASLRIRMPTHLTFTSMLCLPLASVSLFAWLSGNPFNGATFAISSLLLLVLARRNPRAKVSLGRPVFVLLGLASLLFGLVYPHFLPDDVLLGYLYSAPTGLIPCPTLALVIGFVLAFDLVRYRPWAFVLLAIGLFYAFFGVLRLKVYLDTGLLLADTALLFRLVNRAPSLKSETDSHAST